MARRKPRRAKAARAAAKKSTRAAKTRKSTARRASAKRPSARKTARKAAKKAAKKATRRAVARRPVTRAAKKKAAKRLRAGATHAIGIAPVQPAAPAKPAKAPRPKHAPTLDRARKTVGEEEPHGLPSSLDLDRPPSAARSGRREMSERLKEHTPGGPAITAGDVDANWADAESVGDEAPGGDNPTPDQDVVDDIGRALGVEYEDEEELKGGDEIASRDRHRWELDPASSDDYDERD